MPDGYGISLTLRGSEPEEDRIIIIGAMLDLARAAMRREDRPVADYWLLRAAKLLVPRGVSRETAPNTPARSA